MAWYDDAQYDLMAAGADFTNDQYFLPAFGSDLITNGAFTSNITGWTDASTAPGTTSWSAGTLSMVQSTTNAARTRQSITTVAGRLYEVDVTVGAQIVSLQIGTTAGGAEIQAAVNQAAAGVRANYFTATGTTTWIQFNTVAAGTTSIDTVSVREVVLTKTSGIYPKRVATFAEWFAYTASSTTARSYANNTGVIKNDLAANAPRLTYANGKRQFRLEDARTNLALYSADPSNAAWTKAASVVLTAGQSAPDGTTSAYKVDIPTASYGLYQGVTYSAPNVPHTFSVWLRSDSATDILIGLNGRSNVTNNGGLIVSVTTTWQRFAFSKFLQNDVSGTFIIIGTTIDGAPTLSAGSRSVYVWGAQLETNAFASDYIATTSAAVTRAIETARLAPVLETILQRSAASVVVRGQGYVQDNGRILGEATTDAMLLRASNTVVRANKTANLDATLGSAGTLTAANGIAVGFDGVGRSLTGNGGTIATDANGPGDRTTVYLSRDATNVADTYGFGYFDFVGLSPERVSNAQLQAWAVAAGAAVNYTTTITPSSTPIAGASVNPVQSRFYAATITPSVVPVVGSTITPFSTRTYATTITPSATPIVGSTINPLAKTAYATTITASSVPVVGSTISPFATRPYAVTLTPSALPVVGATVTPTASGKYAVTITPALVPITGSTITPVYAAAALGGQVNYDNVLVPYDASSFTYDGAVGSISFALTITPSSVPLIGSTVSPVASQKYALTLTPSSVPVIGSTVSPVSTSTVTLAPSAVPITGGNVSAFYTDVSVPFAITIAPSAVPVIGATLAPVRAASLALAAGSVPITGGTIVPSITQPLTIAPALVPIGGALVSPLWAKAITLTASPVPVVGSSVVLSYGRAITLTPGAVLIGGANVIPAYGQGHRDTAITIAPASTPIMGMNLNLVYFTRPKPADIIGVGRFGAGRFDYGRRVRPVYVRGENYPTKPK